MSKPNRQERRPGRPARELADPEVRAQLIEAGAIRIAAQGYADTSVREIAEAAGVTPAMIAYYFGGKAGLLEAILASISEPLIATIQELARTRAPQQSFVERFVPAYLEVISREPWIAQLLVREVITGRTPARDQFVQRFGSVIGSVVPVLIQAEVSAGRLRSDLDPRLALLSMVGMCIFPFIAHPVVGKVIGYELTPEFGSRLAEHTIRLFLEGAGAVCAPSGQGS